MTDQFGAKQNKHGYNKERNSTKNAKLIFTRSPGTADSITANSHSWAEAGTVSSPDFRVKKYTNCCEESCNGRQNSNYGIMLP
jgi:hypothetical protein